MRNTKILKILNIFLIILFLFNITTAYGFSVTDVTGKQPSSATGVNKIGNSVITIIATVGSFISVVVLVVLGIKYMTGSVEERAQYKSSMMPYFIGAILVFAASTIAGIVYNIAQGI